MVLPLSLNVAAQANDDAKHHCHQERHDQDHANFVALESLIRRVQPLILLLELLAEHRELVSQLHSFGFYCFGLHSRVFDHLLHHNTVLYIDLLLKFFVCNVSFL